MLFFRDMLNSGQPWLRTDQVKRLFTLTLHHVSNPLDGDALWDSATGGNGSIREKQSGKTDRRLLQALKAHKHKELALRGNAPILRSYVFSDIVIWIPRPIWKSADIEGGGALFYMAERLRYQHREAFDKDEFYKNRTPNYSIMPSDSLEPDEIICQFGSGVFIPSDDDQLSAQLQIVKQGHEPQSLGNWIIFEKARDEKGQEIIPPQLRKFHRPMGLYTQQTMFLLGNTPEYSAIQSSTWFSSPTDGAIIINTSEANPTPDCDSEHFDNLHQTRQGLITSCHFQSLTDSQDILTLIIDRTPIQENAVSEVLKQHRHPSLHETGTVMDDDSLFGGLTFMGSSLSENDETPLRYHLEVTGIVLPQLSTSRNTQDITHWLLYLDQDGIPAATKKQRIWCLKGETISHTLFWRQEDDIPQGKNEHSDWQTLEKGETLPYPNEPSRKLEAPELTERQLGILSTPTYCTIPLLPKPLILGRGKNDSSSQPPSFYQPLNLLTDNSTFVYQNGTTKNNLDMLLSSQQIEVSLKNKQLQVKQLSRGVKTYLIQREGGIRQTLSPKNPIGTLRLGESLMIGALRLRFSFESE